jgi:hypothetical protein
MFYLSPPLGKIQVIQRINFKTETSVQAHTIMQAHRSSGKRDADSETSNGSEDNYISVTLR